MDRFTPTSKVISFGVFQADVEARELRKRGVRVRLPDRAFLILTILLDRPQQIVTRSELRNQLWEADTFVDFDHGLNNSVMRLREVLGDSSETPRYIETIPRQGYRFIAPVEEIAPSVEQLASLKPSTAVILEPKSALKSPATGRTNRMKWFAGYRLALPWLAAIVGIGLSTAIAARYVSRAGPGGSKGAKTTSLVVLPLENLSKDKDQDYFADGMTDELIANLAKIRSLRVIPHSTAMAYKGTHKSLSEIAGELNVDAVVEGTVLRSGGSARITAELVQVSSERHLWAETYESQIGDILALQNRVSSAIVNEIRINLTPAEKERLQAKPQVSPQAYENYLKGRYYWNRRSARTLSNAIGYFEQAVHKDPKYVLAYAALADCDAIVSSTIFGTVAPSIAAPKAKAAALRALELEPRSAEAETALATVEFNYDWDWPGVDAGFQRAITLSPDYGTAHQRYSLYLTAMGRFQSSFEQISRARELDPLSLSINFSLGWRLYMAREYDRAIEQLRNTLDMDPSYELPHLVLGQAYEQQGDFGRALPELKRAVELSHGTPLMLAGLAHGYAAVGDRKKAEELISALIAKSNSEYVSPYYIAIVYAGLGRGDQAMNWLEEAFRERANGLVFLRVEPEWDGLRLNPRFRELQRKLNLAG